MSEITTKKSGRELWFWRTAFICAVGFLMFSRSNQQSNEIKEDCLVRTKLYGEIHYDDEVLSKIEELKDNNYIKGVLLQVDCPGGEVTASESLYRAFKSLKEKKPLFVSVQSAAASGGYMAAMPADKIFAYETSAVGSIGVIAYGFEVTDIAQKIGVNLLTYKSSPLKGIPSVFEKPTEETNKSIQGFVDEMDDIFKGMVKTSRPAIGDITKICNGEVYSGRQGVTNGLVDAIGTELDALSDLKIKTSDKLKVIDFDIITNPGESMSFFSQAKKVVKTIVDLL